jgi:amino acid permease
VSVRVLNALRECLTTEGEKFEDAELEDSTKGGARQRDISRQLIVLVDVLYALVLVAGAEAYRSLFTKPGEFTELSQFLPVVLALILIYFTTIHSFIDYHLAAEDQPYQFLDRSKRKTDLKRFYLDVFIVGLYSFLLLKSHVLLEHGDASLTPVFWAMPAIFVLFLWWGRLRGKTAIPSNQRYSGALLRFCTLLYGVLALVYTVTSNGWIGNSEFLFLALLIMAFYRWANWRQNRWCFG